MHEIVDAHILQRVMTNNEDAAEHNREHFNENGNVVINFMSAPGAGKTTLLESCIRDIKSKFKIAVIEGDMVGSLDADRLAKTGAPIHQISTGRACHLDATMIGRLLHEDLFDKYQIVFIENVGNLVCPAEFPLGEDFRIVLLSVSEGDDKPSKYPVIFKNCDAVVLTKCDLLPYVNFDTENATEAVKNLNPNCKVFSLSVQSGEGLSQFFEWLTAQISARQKAIFAGKEMNVEK
jgi:hydrogenase nickel incorporation protein HypB